MMDRLRAYFVDLGVPADAFHAVMALRPSRPYDFARRVRAVAQFRQLPESANLVTANKRIQNILKQSQETVPDTVNEELLAQDAEWNLAAKLVGLSPRVRSLLEGGDYAAALALLAGLHDSVADFFDTVKVMDENEAVRRNRLALLNNISALFLATADISQLQT
jgi:glycyl-tRNA synthetase beta chain